MHDFTIFSNFKHAPFRLIVGGMGFAALLSLPLTRRAEIFTGKPSGYGYAGQGVNFPTVTLDLYIALKQISCPGWGIVCIPFCHPEPGKKSP